MLTLILTLTLYTGQVVLSTPLLFASFFILINALRGAATLLIQVRPAHAHAHACARAHALHPPPTHAHRHCGGPLHPAYPQHANLSR